MAAFKPARIMTTTSGTKQTVTLNNMDGTSMLLQYVHVFHSVGSVYILETTHTTKSL